MKKYLITAALAVAISGAFVSCSDDIASDSLIEQKAKTFEKVFVEAYGTPAPNHTWGFKKNVTRGVNGWKSMSITRGEYADANLWYQTYKVPANVTAKEKKLVTDYFTDHLFVNKYRINNIDFTDFFVYQVYKGEEEYTANNGGKVIGSDHVDHLQTYVGGTMEQFEEKFQNGGGSGITWGNKMEEVGGIRREHMNNFNAGDNQNEVYWDKKPQTDEYKIVGAMLMVNSGTADFSYHGSEDSKYHNTYVIIPGAEIDPSLVGFWYVGFDYYANGQNPNQQVDRDWQFNDWIVRISPAEMVGDDDFEETQIIEHEEIIEAGRVFCEDLGASSLSDVDYNDVVFDAVIVHETKSVDGEVIYENNYAKVCLLAAGGTLPVTVGGHEIHGVLSENKVGTNIMINTIKEEDRAEVNGAGVFQHAPVVIDRIDGVNSIDDIKIYALYNNKVIEVTNNAENLAPYKICVPIGTRWAKERVDIGHAYKKFTNYCSDETVKFWEEAILNDVDNDSIWDDSATPSPFLSYKKGQVIRHDVVTMKTVWKNNGSGEASWNGTYRFGKKNPNVNNNECIATFKEAVWNKIKGSTFYLVVEGENPKIRVTNGWWDANWQPNDITPGNSLLTKNVDEDGEWDETWTLTVNLAGSDFANTIDEKHLLFTGTGFTPVKLFYIE